MKRIYQIAAAGLFAAVAASSAAKADLINLTFSGSQVPTGSNPTDGFIDPNGNTSSWGAFSGVLTWNTWTDAVDFDATVSTSPYGNIVFDGAAGTSISNGDMHVQMDIEISPSAAPYVLTLDIYDPNIIANVLPTYAELASSGAYISVGNDNGADYYYPVSNGATFTLTNVPEPSPLAVLGLGLGLLGLTLRRKRAAQL